MNSTILSSTLILTILLVIGLLFFIKASTKDRIEQIELVSSNDAPEVLLDQLEAHFQKRSYELSQVEPDKQKLVFRGYVKPSWFLAVFLSFLAAVGLACLGLVFSLLYPATGFSFLGISLLSPLAGFFYWRGSGRVENVILQVKPDQKMTVTGHRDELASLKAGFPSLVIND